MPARPAPSSAKPTKKPTSAASSPSSPAARTPKFLRCLYDILFHEDPSILAWAKDGSHFQIFDIPRLEVEVLPKYFKHGKFASFQRQLNNFGWRKWTKTQSSTCTFSHHHYVQCHPDKLAELVAQHAECSHVKMSLGLGLARPSQTQIQAIHNKRKRTELDSNSSSYASPTKKNGIMPYGLRPYDDGALWDLVADVTTADWTRAVKASRSGPNGSGNGNGNETPTSASGGFDFALEEMDDFLPTSWPTHREFDATAFDMRLLYNNYLPPFAHVAEPAAAWDNELAVRNELDYFTREAGHATEASVWSGRHTL